MSDNQVKTEAGWNFDNSYARLPETLFTKQDLNPVRSPKLIVVNGPLAASLGLSAEALGSEEGAAVLAGNRAPEGALPLAQAYAGHQFGHFTMLGDGRALLLGEQMTPAGDRFDIQLKGSGRTPYSRGGDGRAALGPMLREYIISEAMHALGIPTTRSLAVASTGETVMRETGLPGAVLTRVAASHLRVGTFQFAASRGSEEDLRALADYAIERHYPFVAADGSRYLSLLREVVKRQASLIAKWQLVGFVHGVMNTDNMAISGETIDYGPCAFMDAFDPATVFSSIDANGRYAYANQPPIGAWNLARFAEALLPLLHEDEDEAVKLAEEALSAFAELYHRNWLAGMRAKLGLFHEDEQDEALVKELLRMMRENRADYTNTFVALTFDRPEDTGLSCDKSFADWLERWRGRRGGQPETETASRAMMQASNPAVIPRNHRVEEALEAAQNGDLGVMERLLAALADPFAHSPEQAEYAKPSEPSGRPYRTFCGT
ncbi:protein adenylyltransferase SelO [Paenibacillus arenilitoris]|uniref:Protein nucleotidyltransferase YdiU n=1 Tax=Paenibacillus arenilitoris TaxID=2772299 RepID=A0A927H437_9BACL|nr:YdiU family protein [Paenibacillus arenilitoris]MBD2867500.1 YdiU family protein [Paenibacillus arenilitoris]